jgi:outer membrane murein-binding lipoprotein Lpp
MVDVPGDKFNLAALGQESDQDLSAKVYKIMSNMLNFVGLATKDDINRLDARIDKIETGLNARIDKVDIKIDAVSKDLNARIDKVDAKIDAVSKDLNAKIDALGIRMWRVGAAIITTVVVVAKFFAHS